MQTTLLTTSNHIHLPDNEKSQGHRISHFKISILLFDSLRSSRFEEQDTWPVPTLIARKALIANRLQSHAMLANNVVCLNKYHPQRKQLWNEYIQLYKTTGFPSKSKATIIWIYFLLQIKTGLWAPVTTHCRTESSVCFLLVSVNI